MDWRGKYREIFPISWKIRISAGMPAGHPRPRSARALPVRTAPILTRFCWHAEEGGSFFHQTGSEAGSGGRKHTENEHSGNPYIMDKDSGREP